MTTGTRSTPLVSMNLISTKLGIERAIPAYHDAGYEGIGLWYDQVKEYGIGRTRALLEKYPLKVTHLIYAGPFNQTSEREYVAARASDRETLRAAGQLRADTVLAMTGPLNGLAQAEAMRQLRRSLKDLVDTAQECGVKIGLEPLHYILKDDSYLFTLKDALEVVEEIDHPALGLFIDVYHVWHEPGLAESMERATGRIVGCHICDFRPLNRSVYDRVLMGDGVIPVRPILEMVKKAGWSRWYDIEIFSHELWQMEPRAFLKLAREKYDRLMA